MRDPGFKILNRTVATGPVLPKDGAASGAPTSSNLKESNTNDSFNVA
jgi:hypothetical protein